MHRLTYNDVILITRCPDCGGRGSVRYDVNWVPCWKCDGVGRVLKPEAAFRKRMRTIALVALMLAGVILLAMWKWRAW